MSLPATLFAVCGAIGLAILAGLVASSFVEGAREKARRHVQPEELHP